MWLFRGLALVLPILLLVGAEAVLRVAGYGYDAHAILTCKQDGAAYAYNNTRFGWRFFPPYLARESEPFMFRVDKPAKTYRIFVLGASAAMGVPETSFSFARILDVMLRERYPGVKFEMINTAMAAINSHAVAEIAKDCAQYQPDLYIVYLGNNEVIGPYGVGSVFSPFSGSLGMIRASVALRGTRLGQLITQMMGHFTQDTSTPKVWRGLAMFKNNHVPADDPALQAVYDHYAANLADIVASGRHAGAKVLLCTVGSNLSGNAPFASVHKAGLSDSAKQQWQTLYDQGIVCENKGQYKDAVNHYLEAVQVDDQYAELHFRLGRCYWALQQYEAASDHYTQARELDALRFRTDSSINDVIRKTAQTTDGGVLFADTVRAFAEHSDHGVPGDNLFYEHVHMNFKGNYVAAQDMLKQIEPALPDWVIQQKTGSPDPLTEAECAKRLAFTDWDRASIADTVLNRFMKKPPFNTRVYMTQKTETLERELATLQRNLTPATLQTCAKQYAWAIQNRPQDWTLHWKFGRLLTEQFRNYPAAAKEFHKVQSMIPMSWVSYNNLAAVTKAMGDLDTAIAMYKRTLELNTTSGDTYYFLGEIQQKKGQLDKAVHNYRQAIHWGPDCIPAYSNLMRILMNQGQLEQAIAIGRQGIAFSPESATLRGSLGTLLALTGQFQDAQRELETGLKLDPNNATIKQSLNVLKNETSVH